MAECLGKFNIEMEIFDWVFPTVKSYIVFSWKRKQVFNENYGWFYLLLGYICVWISYSISQWGSFAEFPNCGYLLFFFSIQNFILFLIFLSIFSFISIYNLFWLYFIFILRNDFLSFLSQIHFTLFLSKNNFSLFSI